VDGQVAANMQPRPGLGKLVDQTAASAGGVFAVHWTHVSTHVCAKIVPHDDRDGDHHLVFKSVTV
jgi:hypothetical protein